jgi:hypothetical protein
VATPGAGYAMGLVQEIKSRLAPLAALHLRGARGNGREVTSVTTLIANSMLRSPPPAPPQCARRMRRLCLYPAQLLPPVSVAPSSSGASPPPPPRQCTRLVGFAALLAGGGVGVTECAADEEDEAGASSTTSAPDNPWNRNPLAKPVRVPFSGTTTRHGAHATLCTSELRYVIHHH